MCIRDSIQSDDRVSQQEFRMLLILAERLFAELNAFHALYDPKDRKTAKLLWEFDIFRRSYADESSGSDN